MDFHILTIMNNPGINLHVQDFVWTYVLISLGYTPRSGIDGSYGNSMFNHLIYFHTVFQSGCTILHSHQQCMRILMSPHPCQYLLSDFLILVILVDVKWYLTVAFFFKFLKIEVEGLPWWRSG